MLRARGRIEHLSGRDYDLTAAEALYLIFFSLAPELGLTREALSLSPEDIPAAASGGERATG
jgi:hypothetical protein